MTFDLLSRRYNIKTNFILSCYNTLSSWINLMIFKGNIDNIIINNNSLQFPSIKI